MTANDIDITDMIARIDATWNELHASIDGLSDEELLVPGVTESWSVRDILAHVAVWDAYARDALPGIAGTGEHPEYNEDVDTYNARMTEQKRDLSLAEVRRELADTHRNLLEYLRGVSPEAIAGNGPFRERLAADTWDHYPEHAAAIRAWRER